MFDSGSHQKIYVKTKIRSYILIIFIDVYVESMWGNRYFV